MIVYHHYPRGHKTYVCDFCDAKNDVEKFRKFVTGKRNTVICENCVEQSSSIVQKAKGAAS